MPVTLSEVQKELKAKADESVLASIRKFVPSSEHAYGIKMPVLNEMAKGLKEGGFALAEQLWKSGAFEERMLAAKLLNRIARKDPEKTLKLIEKFSKDISDWAVCDTLGMQSPKALNKKYTEEIFAISERLIKSKNLWQRRLALVLSEWYTREPSRHARIRALIAKVKNDDEYYVKKAVKWIERNFEKKR